MKEYLKDRFDDHRPESPKFYFQGSRKLYWHKILRIGARRERGGQLSFVPLPRVQGGLSVLKKSQNKNLPPPPLNLTARRCIFLGSFKKLPIQTMLQVWRERRTYGGSLGYRDAPACINAKVSIRMVLLNITFLLKTSIKLKKCYTYTRHTYICV